MLPWLDSLVVLVIIVMGILFLSRLIRCARRVHSQVLVQSELSDRTHRPGTRRPSWVSPRIMVPPMAHCRDISWELMHSVAMTTSPGRILARTYPLTNPLLYPLGSTPNRTDHPPRFAPDAGRMV